MHGISLSVSALNVLLNLLVIFLVAVGAEIAQYGIYKSTQLQLKRRGEAPFVTEADDIFSHFKNRVSTARESRSVVNLVFVLVSASLIVGEICSEIGVDASHHCDPRMHKTHGICAEPFDHRSVSDSRMVANAYHTRTAGWDNQELEKFPIYEGLRKNFNGREAFNHLHTDTSQRRIVVAGCSTSRPVRIEPNDVTLTISRSMNVWRTFVSQAVTPNGSQPLTGFGDLTSNGKTVSAFLIVPTGDASSHARARLLEYHSKSRLRRLLIDYYKNNSTEDMVIRNAEYMISYDIWCKQFSQSTEKFARALQVYRSVQLEDSECTVQNISIGGRMDETIPAMNGSDAVRAAIALTLSNERSCVGETYEYTECGVYDWKFLAPLLILFGFVVIFAVSNSLMVMMENANVDIPQSSSAWSAVALQYMLQNAGRKGEETSGPEEEVLTWAAQSVSHRGYYQLVPGKDGREDVVLRFKPLEEEGEGEDDKHGTPKANEDQP